jgi:4-amino-4-deoxy-L-arabinose transferase-like glycosyltransferase
MKGPVGIVLPMLVIIPFLAVTGNMKALFNLRIIFGIMLAFIAGGTWYAVEIMIHGRQFFDSVFGFYIIGRYLTSIEQHYGPWYFYFPVILIGFLPWISFLPYAISYQWQRRGDNNNLFSILWMGMVFLFFTLAGTKLPGYIMSFYPIAALAVAKMVQDHLSGEDSNLDLLIVRAYKTLMVVSVLLLVIGTLLKIFEFPESISKLVVNIMMMLMIIGTGGIISSLMFFKEKVSIKPVVVLMVTMFIFSMYTANRTMITLDDFKPMKAISLKINSQFLSREVIIGYKILNKGSFMHYLDKPVIWISNEFDLRDQIKRTERFYLITNEKDFLSFGRDINKPLFMVYKAGDMVLLSNKKQ